MKNRDYRWFTTMAVMGLCLLTVAPISVFAQKASQERLNADLLTAIQRNDPTTVLSLLKQGANPNQRDLSVPPVSPIFAPTRSRSLSPTPLLEAISGIPVTLASGKTRVYDPSENLALITALLDHGANINAKVRFWGMVTTPLGVAIQLCKFTIAHLLVARGANVNAVTEQWAKCYVPLFIYPLEGGFGPFYPQERISLIAEMLDHGAQVNRRDDSGQTALVVAAINLHAVAPLLVAHGADVNARCSDGTTALMWAGRDGTERDLSKLLLSHGADVNARSNEGRTALMNAVAGEDIETIRLLLSHGAEVNIKDDLGESALSHAMDYEQTPPVKQIIALLKQSGGKELPVNRRRRHRKWHTVM